MNDQPTTTTAADEIDEPECDHDWQVQDESFDHEYGTETVLFLACRNCDETKPLPNDYGQPEYSYDDDTF